MKSLAIVAGSMVLLTWSLGIQEQEKTRLVAQGSYSMVGGGADGTKKVAKLDEWSIYANQDGSYSVETQGAAEAPTMKEHYALTKNLTPKAVSLMVSTKDGDSSGKTVSISCDFGSERIVCRVTENGVTASASLAEKLPYVFMPTAEAPSLDLPWFFQTIASQAERSPGQPAAIPLVTIEDGDKAGSIILKVQEIEHVEYLGREKIEVAGENALAHRFRITATDNAEPQDLWLSDSGLLLRLSQQGNPSLILTSYTGPPLTPQR